MDYAVTLDYAVGPYHAGYRGDGGDLGYGDASLFEFGCDRSAAASGGPSSGGEHHRIDA